MFFQRIPVRNHGRYNSKCFSTNSRRKLGRNSCHSCENFKDISVKMLEIQEIFLEEFLEYYNEVMNKNYPVIQIEILNVVLKECKDFFSQNISKSRRILWKSLERYLKCLR